MRCLPVVGREEATVHEELQKLLVYCSSGSEVGIFEARGKSASFSVCFTPLVYIFVRSFSHSHPDGGVLNLRRLSITSAVQGWLLLSDTLR